MLTILDKYIIKKFLTTFLFATILITVVSIIINFAERIGVFIDREISMKDVCIEYYIYFIPWINGLLWPLFVMISVMFFTARMANDTEIIPMLNSGLSFNRILRPYLISAFFLAGIHWYAFNYIIPISNEYKYEFDRERLKKNKTKTRSSNVHFFVSPESKIFIRYYRRTDSSGQNFRLETLDENGGLKSVLKARKIRFKERPYTWTLEDYSKRSINGNKEDLLLAKGEKLDTVFNFAPEDFVEHLTQMEVMPTNELKAFVKKEESRGIGNTKKYYIELSKRTAIPFSIIILTLIGASVSSRKVRGGMGLHMAIGVVIGAVFEVLSKFSTTFAANLNWPIDLCIWIPNIIFSIVAIILVKSAQK